MLQTFGFGVSGYRSFYSLQKLGPLKKINLIVGRNNSGKSNLLRFAADHLPELLEAAVDGKRLQFKDLERPIFTSGPEGRPAFSLAMPPTDSEEFSLWEQGVSNLLTTNCREFLIQLAQSLDNWADFIVNDDNNLIFDSAQLDQLSKLKIPRPLDNWFHIGVRLGQGDLGNLNQKILAAVPTILRFLPSPPPVQFIPAFREIRSLTSG